MDNNYDENITLDKSWQEGMTLITTNSDIQSINPKFLPQTCLLNVIHMDQLGNPTLQLVDPTQTVGLMFKTDENGSEEKFEIETPDPLGDLTLSNEIILSDMDDQQFHDEKPLGSSENPIQFIQHGETYHSTQKISQEQLKQIAEALHLQTGKTNQNTILMDPTCSNSKIVYRVVYPEDLDLQPLKQNSKRGRPKRKEGGVVASAQFEHNDDEEEFLQPLLTKSVRTRSGRITKPPRHIQKAFKQVDPEPRLQELPQPSPLNDCRQLTSATDVVQPKTNSEQRKRHIAAQFRCPICKKAYLGRSRMIKHFELNPDHGPIPDNLKPKYDDLWTQTVERAMKAPENQRAQQFCNELSRMIRNARILVPFLFKPATGMGNCYQVDDNLANALGLHPGNYSLDNSALVKDISLLNLPDAISSSLHANLIDHSNLLNTHSIDELILPVVDTGQVSMNLDMTSTNSDDVMNVDQLVNERLKNLTDAELEPNINHALNLDLGLDLFSFNPS